jgi:hypothetical protein
MADPGSMTATTLERLLHIVAAAAEEQGPAQLDAAASAWDQLTAHPDWPPLPRSARLAAFDDAGVAFAVRYRASGRMADLGRAITIYEAALAEVPPTEPDHPVLLTSLANRLGSAMTAGACARTSNGSSPSRKRR